MSKPHKGHKIHCVGNSQIFHISASGTYNYDYHYALRVNEVTTQLRLKQELYWATWAQN